MRHPGFFNRLVGDDQAMPKPAFDALFIDFYGTVTSGDRQAVEHTSARVVEELHLPMTPAEFAVEWGKVFFAAADGRNHERFANLYETECESLIQTLAPLGRGHVDPHPFVRQLQAYWANPTLHPESAEVLASIEIPICCVSNADTADLLSAAERHHLRFDHVVTSEDVRCYKPAPEIFQRALADMGVSPDRVLHAGDSLHADVSGAKPLGITTAWVCRQGRIYDVGQEAPDYKFSCLRGLRDLLALPRGRTSFVNSSVPPSADPLNHA